jgi:hypothetical protein
MRSEHLRNFACLSSTRLHGVVNPRGDPTWLLRVVTPRGYSGLTLCMQAPHGAQRCRKSMFQDEHARQYGRWERFYARYGSEAAHYDH